MVALAQLNHGDGEASRQAAGASRQIENPLSDPFNIFLVPKLRLGTPFCQALAGSQSDDATQSFARRRSQAELGNQKTTESRVAVVLSADPVPAAAPVSQEMIRQAAYRRWEEAGFPPGDGVQF